MTGGGAVELVANGKHGRGGARLHADLLHGVLDVIASRALADGKGRSNLAVAQSLRQKLKDIEFAGGSGRMSRPGLKSGSLARRQARRHPSPG